MRSLCIQAHECVVSLALKKSVFILERMFGVDASGTRPESLQCPSGFPLQCAGDDMGVCEFLCIICVGENLSASLSAAFLISCPVIS